MSSDNGTVIIRMLLLGAGCAFSVWARAVTDPFNGWRLHQPGPVTTGVYRVIRHPSYLGLLITSLGWGLAFRSGIGLLLAALLVPPLLVRIRAEDRLLRAQFGAEHEAYCARTSRLIPGLY